MNCATPGSPDYDLRDFYFEDLDPAQNQQVKEHLARCPACLSELEQLRVTAVALHALPDEEIPRRIAFVSDKVFEPSSVQRWLQSFWISGARMGSLAAMLLAAAILIHAYRPAQVIRVIEPGAGSAGKTINAVDPVAMQAAVDRAVSKAVNEAENRYDLKLKRVILENDKRQRESMARVSEYLDTMDRRSRVMTVASNRLMDAGQ